MRQSFTCLSVFPSNKANRQDVVGDDRAPEVPRVPDQHPAEDHDGTGTRQRGRPRPEGHGAPRRRPPPPGVPQSHGRRQGGRPVRISGKMIHTPLTLQRALNLMKGRIE